MRGNIFFGEEVERMLEIRRQSLGVIGGEIDDQLAYGIILQEFQAENQRRMEEDKSVKEIEDKRKKNRQRYGFWNRD